MFRESGLVSRTYDEDTDKLYIRTFLFIFYLSIGKINLKLFSSSLIRLRNSFLETKNALLIIKDQIKSSVILSLVRTFKTKHINF